MINFKKIREHRIFVILTNRYVLISLGFIIWMLFLDSNSLLNHRDLNREKRNKEKEKAYFEAEIEKDREIQKQMENEKELETFAREEYYMKRPEEEIYIIEEDTLSDKE